MYCKGCGKEIKDGSLFCPECGVKQEGFRQMPAKKPGEGSFIPMLLCLVGILFLVIYDGFFYFLNGQSGISLISGLAGRMWELVAAVLLIPAVYYLCKRLYCTDIKLLNVMIIICCAVMIYQTVCDLLPEEVLLSRENDIFYVLRYMHLFKILYGWIAGGNLASIVNGTIHPINYVYYLSSFCFAAAEFICLAGFVNMKRKAVKGIFKGC